MERMGGFEPSSKRWRRCALPLSYTRDWWTDRESNSARRSCKDQLRPSARPEKIYKGEGLAIPLST